MDGVSVAPTVLSFLQCQEPNQTDWVPRLGASPTLAPSLPAGYGSKASCGGVRRGGCLLVAVLVTVSGCLYGRRALQEVRIWWAQTKPKRSRHASTQQNWPTLGFDCMTGPQSAYQLPARAWSIDPLRTRPSLIFIRFHASSIGHLMAVNKEKSR